MECGEYLDHEFHHLPKCADYYACSQAKMKMKPARRRDPDLKERPAAWSHTLLGGHIFAADLDLERVDFKLGTTLLDAGTLFGDLVVVSSKNANDTIMAFREFYGEDPFYCVCIFTRATRRSPRPQQSRNSWCTSPQHRTDQSPTASWRGSISSSSMELDAFYFKAGCRSTTGTTRAGPSSWLATPAWRARMGGPRGTGASARSFTASSSRSARR